MNSIDKIAEQIQSSPMQSLLLQETGKSNDKTNISAGTSVSSTQDSSAIAFNPQAMMQAHELSEERVAKLLGLL